MSVKSLDSLVNTLNQFRALLPDVDVAADHIKSTYKTGCKILTAGNGGSAADALHLAEELVGRFEKNRSSLPAVCISSDPTIITCIANDYGYDSIFSRQIEGLGTKGDLLVVFSTSGNSENIIRGLQSAKAKGVFSIALLGRDGGRAKSVSDMSIIVPSQSTARIQEVHTFILHCWLERIESGL